MVISYCAISCCVLGNMLVRIRSCIIKYFSFRCFVLCEIFIISVGSIVVKVVKREWCYERSWGELARG